MFRHMPVQSSIPSAAAQAISRMDLDATAIRDIDERISQQESVFIFIYGRVHIINCGMNSYDNNMINAMY
jgi:hypothetical protein